jgi:predicted nucleotidyltransferase component of viral defense system
MLQKQAVKPELLELLNQLMLINEFNNFHLVGGTALALYDGHRISVDIDLFGKSHLEENKITSLIENCGNTKLLSKSQKILIYTVNGIKVDFVDYQYELIEPVNIINGIRILSKKDIAAMKLNAIVGRGSKKDFFDIVQLLKTFTFTEMLSFYTAKYKQNSEFMVIKSLMYFDDAELEPDPITLVPISWEDIKIKIIDQVKKL